MPDLTGVRGPVFVVAHTTCQHRHVLEWVAPIARMQPCEECVEITTVVLTAAGLIR